MRKRLAAGCGAVLGLVGAPSAADELTAWFPPGRTWSHTVAEGEGDVQRVWLSGVPAAVYVRRVQIGLTLRDEPGRHVAVAECRPASYSWLCTLENGGGDFRLKRFGCEIEISAQRPLQLDGGAATREPVRYFVRQDARQACRILR